MMMEELLHVATAESEDPILGIQMALAMLRDELPWIYEVGMETLKILKSKSSTDSKAKAIDAFVHISRFSLEHPLMREQVERSKDWHFIAREFPRFIAQAMYRTIGSANG